MAGFSFKKLFRQQSTTSKHRPSATNARPLDAHSLALSRSLSTVTPSTKRYVSVPSLPGRPSASAPPEATRLPPELILLIFSHIPTSSLPLISVLCRATRAWAEERLYFNPSLSTARSVNLLLRTLKRDLRLAGMVRGLVMDGSDGQGGRRTITGRLSQLLEVCRGLERLEVKEAVVYSLTDFANATNLSHLILAHSILSDRTTTSRYHPFFTTLPRLSLLTLSCTSFDLPTARHFLCPTTMPVLKELDMDALGLVDDPERRTDLGMYEPALLAEELEFLRVGDSRSPPDSAPSTFIAQCPNLLGLSLPLHVCTESALEALPAGLAYLEIRSPPSSTSPTADEEDPLSEEDTLAHLTAALALSSSFLALSSFATNLQASASHSGAGTPSYGLSRSPSSANFGAGGLGTSPGGLSALFERTSLGCAGTEEGAGGVDKLDTPLGALRLLRLPAEWGAWEMALHSSATPSWSRSGSRHDLHLRPSLSRSTTHGSLNGGRARGFSLSSVASASGGKWAYGSEEGAGQGEMGWALSRIGRVGTEREVEVDFGTQGGEGWGEVKRQLGL